jgi:DNA-binding MarR family transcriptional regulator
VPPESNASRSSKSASGPTPWLSSDEEAAWRALASVCVTLPWALECQLRRDADLSFLEYHVLARLSEEPARTMRMSVLAELTHSSLSRLSHLAKRLEAVGLIRREPDPTDGRFTNAILTETGYAKLVATAPAHVERVRALVIDAFTPDELQQVRGAAQRLLTRITTTDTT